MSRFSLPTKPDHYKLSQETADAAVVELLAYYEIDVDEIPEDQRSVFAANLAKLSRYYRMGLLENVRGNDGTLSVKQHLQTPPGDVRELVYGRMTGAVKLTMDAFPPTAFYARTHALMGALCQTPMLDKLEGNDHSVVECLGLVFLAG